MSRHLNTTERSRLLAALDALCAHLRPDAPRATKDDDLSAELPDAPEPVTLVLQRFGVFLDANQPPSPQRDDRVLSPPEMELERAFVGAGLFPLIVGPDDLEHGLQRTWCVREDAPWGPMALWQAVDHPLSDGPTVAAWFETVLRERAAPDGRPAREVQLVNDWQPVTAPPHALEGKAWAVFPEKSARMLSLWVEPRPGVWLRGEALWRTGADTAALDAAAAFVRQQLSRAEHLWAEEASAVQRSLSVALDQQRRVLSGTVRVR
ncbi:MAG: hypothetical protein ACOZQL_29155 [Myxococcota bacterium]